MPEDLPVPPTSNHSDEPIKSPVGEHARRDGFNVDAARIRNWVQKGHRGVRLDAERQLDSWVCTAEAWAIFYRAFQAPSSIDISGSLFGGRKSIPVTPAAGLPPLPASVQLGLTREPSGPGQSLALGWLPNPARGRLLAIYQRPVVGRPPRIVPIPLGVLLGLFRDSREYSAWWKWRGLSEHYESALRFEDGELIVSAGRADRVGSDHLVEEEIRIVEPRPLREALRWWLCMSQIVVGVRGANIAKQYAADRAPCPICRQEGATPTHGSPCSWMGTDDPVLAHCSWEREGAVARTYVGHFLHVLNSSLQAHLNPFEVIS